MNNYRKIEKNNYFRDPIWKSISKTQKKEIGFISDNVDGEFYMSFHDDFMKYFSDIDVVHKTPDTMGIEGEDLTEANHDLQMFYGAWDKSQDTAGGAGMGIGGKLDFVLLNLLIFVFKMTF